MHIYRDALEGLPPHQWPKLHFNWDTSSTAYLHTVDAPSGLQPRNHVPEELELSLGWAPLLSIDARLAPYSRQEHIADFWQLGLSHKFTRLLKHLADGCPISPPMLKVVESGHLFLAGGHHRYAIARVAQIQELPFFVEASARELVAGVVPVRWSAA